ncbi:MAG TPA: glycosyltransferase family 2 protein [Chitinophagaceae bacterium]|nr:glycosyltransferase family 2 protein [Chitinophagaceae bacterium]
MGGGTISVVIICFNAAATIGQTLLSASELSHDIIVVDSGSTDETVSIAREAGACVLLAQWKGFGANKNFGNEHAQNDWILSLDADEVLSTDLIAVIRDLDFSDPKTVFKLRRLNYLNNKPVYHGEWGNDWTSRIFNRKAVQWNAAPVHERLQLPPDAHVKKIPGLIHHFTASDIGAYNNKLDVYADLVAEKYFAKGEKGMSYKVYLSPLFSFLKSYVVYAGWMDKKEGWQIAVAHARYSFRKYRKLAQLSRQPKARNHPQS